MVKPGTYKATIVSHAITETKAGLPQASVTFNFESEGRTQSMTWFGSFKEGKAREITVKSLLVCGLKGNNPAGDLEIGREVSIVIEDETGEDGKARSRIRWINPVGAVRNVIPKDQAKAKLADLEGAIMAARLDLNLPETDSEIPF